MHLVKHRMLESKEDESSNGLNAELDIALYFRKVASLELTHALEFDTRVWGLLLLLCAVGFAAAQLVKWLGDGRSEEEQEPVAPALALDLRSV